MKKGQKKPYYGQRTKRQVINEFLTSSASMDELSELHGVLGSNTLSEWVKKYGNLPPKSNNKRKPHSPLIDKKRRKKRFKMDAHFRISELEEEGMFLSPDSLNINQLHDLRLGSLKPVTFWRTNSNKSGNSCFQSL